MNSVENKTVLGVDLGGTKVNVGSVQNGQLLDSFKLAVPVTDVAEEVTAAICLAIDSLFDDQVEAIGVGVPSIVDIEVGIVYDVQNIPSWKEIHLKKILEDKYGVPVHLNNDANCFALGEKYFGEGRGHRDFVGLIVGTGMAAGIIIDDKLYSGANCGSGEFGMLPYLDHYFEYYSSGQFFANIYDTSGQEVSELAGSGDDQALKIYSEFGTHLGNAINAILYTLDPELIIMGGSVSRSYRYFEKSMWKQIHQLAYRPSPDRLTIEISSDPNIPVLGAASLCYEADNVLS